MHQVVVLSNESVSITGTHPVGNFAKIHPKPFSAAPNSESTTCDLRLALREYCDHANPKYWTVVKT